MSNRINLVSTEFNSSVTGDKTYGFRIYDDYGQSYDNNSETNIKDDLELLQYALKKVDDDIVVEMLRFIQELEMGMYINDNWYDWNDIKNYFT